MIDYSSTTSNGTILGSDQIRDDLVMVWSVMTWSGVYGLEGLNGVYVVKALIISIAARTLSTSYTSRRKDAYQREDTLQMYPCSWPLHFQHTVQQNQQQNNKSNKTTEAKTK
jgi:hypothetical protein